jgi:hypothetical protein
MISRIDFYSGERSSQLDAESFIISKPEVGDSDKNKQEEMGIAAQKFHQTIYEKAK